MIDIVLIEDNDFMGKDVTLLGKDYYLFHVDDKDIVYFYHQGCVFVGKVTDDGGYGNWVQSEEYTEGTLSQYVETLKEV